MGECSRGLYTLERLGLSLSYHIESAALPNILYFSSEDTPKDNPA